MEALIFMIPIALALGFCFLGAFIWANNNGQFDDLVTPAHRMLNDNDNDNDDDDLKSINNKGRDTNNESTTSI